VRYSPLRLKTQHVEALAIRGERIVATGTTAAVSRLSGPKTRKIDLHGATVIPGINDAHIHLEISPNDSIDVEVEGRDPSWQEMRTALAAAAAKAPRGALLQLERSMADNVPDAQAIAQLKEQLENAATLGITWSCRTRRI
jgi:predicted amidohydrolase YtcJ